MRMLGFMWLTLVVACGYGFQPVVPIDGAVEDTGGSPDAPPDAPTVLGCTPARFQVSPAAKWVTAVGTPRGYDVFIVEDSGNVLGYAYQFVDDKLELVPGTGGQLDGLTSVGPVAALAIAPLADDSVDVMVAVTYEVTTAALTTVPLGTVVVPFDAQLHRLAPGEATRNDGLVVIPGGLAGGEDGKVAFLGMTDVNMLALQQVSRRGVAVGKAESVDSLGNKVTRHTLLRGPSGYLAVWSDNESIPEAVTAVVINDNLQSSRPIVINQNPPTGHGSLEPFAAYLPGAHRYLFSWLEKADSSSDDAIKLRMKDDQFSDTPGVLGLPQQLGGPPVIGAGDNDFIVAWKSINGQMAVARVKPDGSLLVDSPTSTGGAAVHFDVAVHNGQAVVFWVEADRTPNLWIDAVCRNAL